MTVKEIYGTDFPIILAPMAGITDLPFRILCKEQGADVMVTEMISAKALFYGMGSIFCPLSAKQRSTMNSLPLPGSLSMAMVPPIRSTMFLVMDMPRPVP